MRSRHTLRKNLRQQRRTLTPAQQHRFSDKIARHICHSHLFRSAQHIACYLANDGEVNLKPVIQRIWRMGKQCYLPLLSEGKDKHLWFAPYTTTTPLKSNSYGIPEPQNHPGQWLAAQQLDLVLMPLVGFDNTGNRLGMGGGYYDRSFAFLNRSFGIKKPRLLGAAYELQRCDNLPTEAWDVPLNAIATERGLYAFQHGREPTS